MKTGNELKSIVREKYAQIAKAVSPSCCTPDCCSTDTDFTIMSDDYSKLDGYVPEADLKLGCGLPTEHAGIREGQTLLDLGSGAGNDCFIARQEVGEKGKVIGIDFTLEMVQLARKNAEKMGFKNVQFLLGEIEALPLADESVDVVVSNCVMNLVPDKKKAFEETHRVLAAGGHFSISDIVLEGDVPEHLLHHAEAYAGCVSGAIQKPAYLEIVRNAGFTDLEVKTEKEIVLPKDWIEEHFTKEDITAWEQANAKVLSITLNASKPA